MSTRPLRWLAVLFIAACALLVAPLSASADSAASVAYLRGAHLSPDTPAVDVYLTAFSGGKTTLWLSKVGYGDVSSYERVPAGTYAVAMRPHGAASSTKPVLSWTIHLTAGKSYTAAAIGDNSKLQALILPDSSSAATGHGMVRVIEAADRAASFNIKLGSTRIADNLKFGSISNYAAVPAGTHAATVTAASGSSASTSTQVAVASNSVTSLVVLDAQGGGIAVRALTDSAGASQVPQGSVDAGGGGTAQHVINGASSSSSVVPVVAGVGGGLLLAGLAGGTLRRRRA